MVKVQVRKGHQNYQKDMYVHKIYRFGDSIRVIARI